MESAVKERTPRAQAMSLEDRQAMIIDAVIPLLLQHGRSLTSKQIAEAAGIAEGTVFRAFGDKETLLRAAIDTYLDPEPLREALRSIDPVLPLQHKIREIIRLLRARFESVMRMMAVIGPERPPVKQERQEYAKIIARILEPEAEQLNWPPDRIAHILRLISFASAFPALNEGDEFGIDELADIALVGIAGKPFTIVAPRSAECPESAGPAARAATPAPTAL